jgi:hypothetical protein
VSADTADEAINAALDGDGVEIDHTTDDTEVHIATPDDLELWRAALARQSAPAPWTVVGTYDGDGDDFIDHVWATSASAAVLHVQAAREAYPGTLRFHAVFAGTHACQIPEAE